MQKRSHKLLASQLLEARNGFQRRRFELAFLFGSFQPDCNPLSYLKGSIRSRTFRGHNYTNSDRYIVSRILRLQRREKVWTCWQYYTLGKLTHYLADAFTIPGVTLLLSGLLVWCTRKGAFDGVTFSVGLFFHTIFRPGTMTKQKYPDYVAEKQEKRKEKPGYTYLYAAGGIYLVVAIVFLLFYYL